MNEVIVVLDDGETFGDAFGSELLVITEEGWEAYQEGDWESPEDIPARYVKHRIDLGELIEAMEG
jgi:hypothetical protein